METYGEIVFNGENVEEVVNFMNEWCTDLCGYCAVHKIVKYNGESQVYGLTVEPSDIMRRSSVYIKTGQKAVRMKNGYINYIKVMDVVN